MVSIFTDIPDPFDERKGLKKDKDQFGDLIDDVDDLVMYGSQKSSAMAISICLVTIPKLSTSCGVYSIEKSTKYSIG